MFALTGLRRSFALSIILIAGFSSLAYSQKPQATTLPVGTPVTWRDPGDITRRDLRFGPGFSDGSPLNHRCVPTSRVENLQN